MAAVPQIAVIDGTANGQTAQPVYLPDKESSGASKVEAGNAAAEQGLGANTPEYKKDTGWRPWCSVIASFLQLAICLGAPNAYGVYQAEYSLVQFPDSTYTAISFIGGTTLATLVTSCLVCGRLCEIHGPVICGIIGTLVTVVALLGASWCHSVPTLIATQGILQGLGGGGIFVCATWIVPQWFVKKRAQAMGIASAGLGAGGIAWSYIYRACIGSLGYQWSLRISAFITLVVMIISLLIIRIPPASRQASRAGSWKEAFLQYGQEKWLIAYWLGFFFLFFGFSTPQFYLAQYIQTLSSATPSQGATISAAINVGAVVGRVIMGFMGDSRIGIMNVFCMGIVVSAILQLCMWLPAKGNMPASFTFAVLYGLTGVGAIGVAPAVLAVHLDPAKIPSIWGVFVTSEIIGFLTGPSIAGAILAASGFKAVIAYSGAMMLTGSLLAVLARYQIAKGKWLVRV